MPPFDRSRLEQARYTLKNGLDVRKFQDTVEDFVGLARKDKLADDQTLIQDFCALVNKQDTWHHACMVVPEFRRAKTRPILGEPADASIGIQMSNILDQLQSLLPPPLLERDILTSEQDLLSQRFGNWITCTRNVIEKNFRDERGRPEAGNPMSGKQKAPAKKATEVLGKGKPFQDESGRPIYQPYGTQGTIKAVTAGETQASLNESAQEEPSDNSQPVRKRLPIRRAAKESTARDILSQEEPSDDDIDSEAVQQPHRLRRAVKGVTAGETQGSLFQPSQEEPSDDDVDSEAIQRPHRPRRAVKGATAGETQGSLFQPSQEESSEDDSNSGPVQQSRRPQRAVKGPTTRAASRKQVSNKLD
ncbi:MAG: hypothetical protein LQ349_001829 [Xanthoria aureola]|nr:MAG: hypothetical protein LQ349_001829 [Xanthoria aureola]